MAKELNAKVSIQIIAPSSKVPQIELQLGIERIRKEGFRVKVHPQCKKAHLFFAGQDEVRAQAFYESAKDSDSQILWCARGGHGAIRVLPLLEKFTQTYGIPPRKLLVGYSDATALMEFVRNRWNWSTLHGPMPTWRKFTLIGSTEWDVLCGWLRKLPYEPSWVRKKLKFWVCPPARPVEGSLVGGNLTVLQCMLGTPFQAQLDQQILFLEDVDEGMYRMDRALQQWILSGSLNRIKAIVLGNFLNCKDHVPSVLKTKPSEKRRRQVLEQPRPSKLVPLRAPMREIYALKRIFSEVGRQLQVPVAFGLPVGHGPEVAPLPLGAQYRLSPEGYLELMDWDWIKA